MYSRNPVNAMMMKVVIVMRMMPSPVVTNTFNGRSRNEGLLLQRILVHDDQPEAGLEAGEEFADP